MGNEKLEPDVREPDDREGEAEALEGQHTEELPEVVIIDPEGSFPPGVTPDSAPTVVEEHGEDDVYVILPEGDTSEIPVVETQVLDDATETSDIGASETSPLDPVGQETDAISLSGTTQFANAETETAESQDTQHLDDLTSEIDDQLLAEEAGRTSEIMTLPTALEGGQSADGSAGHEAAGAGYASSATSQTRPWFKVAIAAAALVSISAAGFWYLGGFGEQFQGGSHSNGSPGTVAVVVPHTTSGEGGTGAPGGSGDPNATAGGSPSTEHDVALASREAFRGKLLAALDLGFGGEVKHE